MDTITLQNATEKDILNALALLESKKKKAVRKVCKHCGTLLTRAPQRAKMLCTLECEIEYLRKQLADARSERDKLELMNVELERQLRNLQNRNHRD